MKKIISAVLITTALLSSSFAYSDNGKKGKPVNKEIVINGSFQKIKTCNNVQLVLVQDPTRSTILVTGDEKSVEAIKVNIEKGLLSIDSKKNLKPNVVKIYVPVTALTSLELGNNATVSAEGFVKLNGFKILVHDGSKVMLRVLGDFEVEAADGCDVVYEKYERANVVFIER